MQQEHLLKKVSVTDKTALQEEFLQIHVSENIASECDSGAIRIGISRFGVILLTQLIRL